MFENQCFLIDFHFSILSYAYQFDYQLLTQPPSYHIDLYDNVAVDLSKTQSSNDCSSLHLHENFQHFSISNNFHHFEEMILKQFFH